MKQLNRTVWKTLHPKFRNTLKKIIRWTHNSKPVRFKSSLLVILWRIVRTTYRSSHRRCSVGKGVLRNYAKFTRKHLCQSIFFNNVAGLFVQLYLKKDSGTSDFQRILRDFKNTFFKKHLQGTACRRSNLFRTFPTV